MKQLWSLMGVLFATVTLHAGQKQVATLCHDGTETHYYGSDAYVNAKLAATNGDAIYLSAGRFSGNGINKAISIYGAGMGQTDSTTVTTVGATVIEGENTISIPADSVGTLYIEGVYFSQPMTLERVEEGVFAKCYFQDLWTPDEYYTDLSEAVYDVNYSFYNCVSEDTRVYGHTTMAFFNSRLFFAARFIPYFHNFRNCLIEVGSPYHFSATNATMVNCIIYPAENAESPFSWSELENCLVVKPINASSTCLSGNLYTADSSDDVFEAGTYYHLKANAASTFVDFNGDQIGIYGGEFPFSVTPTNPQIGDLTVTEGDNIEITIDLTNQ